MSPMPSLISIVQIALGLLGLYVLKTVYSRRSLPPGPRGWPIVGNLFDLPKEHAWREYAKHKDRYGGISSVTVFGQTFIIMNDLQMTLDLLNRSTFSDRPRLVFAGEMVGWDRQMILSHYGDRFRTMRRYVAQWIGTKSAVSGFKALHELESRYFLARMLASPDKLPENIRIMAGSIFLKMSHGYSIETEREDPLVHMVETAAKEFYVATGPGAWLVDTIPWLKELPDWLPGQGFKKVAARFRATNMEQADRPHQWVKRQVKAGTAVPSFTSRMLENDLNEYEEDAVKWAANSMYGGGTDTVVASLCAFFLAMIMFPEVQKKAQAELDSVIGTSRLPTMEDRSRLPYIDACMKEVLRWNPIGPLGIPHHVTENDVYNGYFIPKGSIVLTNIWGFAHDPATYPDPEVFRPERYLDTDGHTPERDPHTLAFGFGRRSCPGQELADAVQFITIASTLAVFTISKAKDAKGREIEPRCEFTSGTVSHPKPYKYSIAPRSNDAKVLIRAVGDEPPRPSDSANL